MMGQSDSRASPATGTTPSPAKRNRWPWVCFLVGATVLCACFVLFILGNHYIKAYSDSVVWLKAAQDPFFTFRHNALAPVYPFYLALAMNLVGPIYVFLANLPLLLVLAGGAGILSALSLRDSSSPCFPPMAALAVTAFFLGFNPHQSVYLTNPYRDALAAVLMLAATILVVVSTQSRPQRLGLLGVGGLLLGLAYCTRETAVLMTAPLFLYGLVCWYTDRSIRIGGSVFFFLAGLVAGVLPAIVHSALTTQQVLLPSYAAHEGRLMPGFHLAAFNPTFRRAVQSYAEVIQPWQWLLLASGLAGAALQRNRVILTLVLPSAAMYFLFFSFYWTFSLRYFFVVDIFLVVMIGFGFHILLGLAARTMRLGRWTAPVHTAACLIVTTLICVQLAGYRPQSPLFQIAEAKRLKQDVEAYVPEDAHVLSQRMLCEVLDTITHAHSYSATRLAAGPEAGLDFDTMRDRIQQLLEAGVQLFVATWGNGDGSELESPLVHNYFDLEPVAVFRSADYHLQAVCGTHDIRLLRLRPWSTGSVAREIQPEPGLEFILRLNAGVLWQPGYSQRREATLFLGERLLDDRVENGANYYTVSAEETGSPQVVRLESDAPVPSELQLEVLPASKPLRMDLRPKAAIDHGRYLSAGLNDDWDGTGGRVLWDRGTIDLPIPWKEANLLFAVFHVHSPDDLAVHIQRLQPADRETDFTVSVSDSSQNEGTLRVTVPVPPGRQTCPVTLLLDPPEGGTVAGQAQPFPGIFFDHVDIQRLRHADRVHVDLGTTDDAMYVVRGLYPQERTSANRTVRWTGQAAELQFGMNPGGQDYRLNLVAIGGHRPEGAPAASPSLLVNGQAIDTLESIAGAGRITTYTVLLPNRMLRKGLNRLEITCTPWVPREYGLGSNSNALGIMLDSLELHAEATASTPRAALPSAAEAADSVP